MAEGIKIDRKAFDTALAGFERDTGISAHEVMVDSMRSILRGVVRAMPPKTAAAGRRAIRSDVNKILDFFDNKAALIEMDDLFEDRFFPLRFDAVGGAAAEAEIEKFRTNKGRVPRSYKTRTVKAGPYTFGGKRYVSKREYNRIIRKKQAKVGQAKAGFRQAAKKFGLMLPGWIDRHTSAPGFGRDTYTKGSTDYYLEAVNAVPHAQRHKGLLTMSMGKVVYAMRSRMDRQLVRIANKHSAK